VRATVTVRGTFSASHQVSGHSTCGKLHGHSWTVDATVEGPLSPKSGMVVDHGEFAEAVDRVCRELDKRDLNGMLPGVVPVPEGIAGYVREQLILSFPTVISVMVRCDDYAALLEWPLR